MPRKKSQPVAVASNEYLIVSRRPLPSLAFLLPVIVLYELGTLFFARDPATGAETRIIAFNFLSSFLHLFGGTGRFLPAAAVISVLLAIHVSHGDPWRFKPRVLGCMTAEAAAWGIPLLMLGVVLARMMSLSGHPAASGKPSLAVMLVLSLGAGVYEELVFRLAGFAALGFLFGDVLGFKPRPTAIATTAITAVTFSLYHYLGDEPFHLRTFVFRALAGVFFGVLYLTRGFGVTAGSHVAYDVFVQFLSA